MKLIFNGEEKEVALRVPSAKLRDEYRKVSDASAKSITRAQAMMQENEQASEQDKTEIAFEYFKALDLAVINAARVLVDTNKLTAAERKAMEKDGFWEEQDLVHLQEQLQFFRDKNPY